MLSWSRNVVLFERVGTTPLAPMRHGRRAGRRTSRPDEIIHGRLQLFWRHGDSLIVAHSHQQQPPCRGDNERRRDEHDGGIGSVAPVAMAMARAQASAKGGDAHCRFSIARPISSDRRQAQIRSTLQISTVWRILAPPQPIRILRRKVTKVLRTCRASDQHSRC